MKQSKFSVQKISTEGEFSLWVVSPVYKTLYLSNGYFIDNDTGENCGSTVYLYKHYYKDGKKLEEPEYDEDHYTRVYN